MANASPGGNRSVESGSATSPLDFDFNTSLTALNLAKVDAYLSLDYDADTPFSMTTQKMVHFNEHLPEKGFSILDFDLSLMI